MAAPAILPLAAINEMCRRNVAGMPTKKRKQLLAKLQIIALCWLALAMCAPPTPSGPRPTAATILEITPAPTLNLDATATVYAQQLVATPTPAGLYVVQQGDTLSGLAEDFGTTIEELMAANGLTDPNALAAGQTLIIPSLISDTLTLETPAPTAPTSGITGTATVTGTAAPAQPPTPTLSTP
jgi:LysM repeat protein